ncbi:MAG: hypothetical protein GXX79_15610 [Actinomycetales bacterium]|nr:hypothetical protein [Actinomycetales bacterium]
MRQRLVVVADQGASSLSNLLAVVLVARALGEQEFGRFAIAYAILVSALGVSRSWFGTSISLRTTREAVRAETAASLGALSVLSPLLLLVVMVPAWAVTDGRDAVLTCLVAVSTPVVCLQDALRFGAVASRRPGVALASDLTWLLAMAAIFPVANRLGAAVLLSAWTAAAVAALLVALVGLRVRPDLRAGVRALRSIDRTSGSVAYGTVVMQGASILVVSAVGASISDAAAGSIRGAGTLVGPLNVLLAFVNLALTPALARRSRSADRRFCLLTATGVLAVVIVWGAMVLALPDRWGTALLGDTWDGARSVLPFTVLEYVGVGLAAAWTLGLKVRGEAGRLIRQKTVVAMLTAALGVTAALAVGEVRAVSLALAVSAGVGAAVGWWHLRISIVRTTG